MKPGESVDDHLERSRVSLEAHVRERDQAQRMAQINGATDEPLKAQARPRTLAEHVAQAGQRAPRAEGSLTHKVEKAEHQATVAWLVSQDKTALMSQPEIDVRPRGRVAAATFASSPPGMNENTWSAQPTSSESDPTATNRAAPWAACHAVWSSRRGRPRGPTPTALGKPPPVNDLYGVAGWPPFSEALGQSAAMPGPPNPKAGRAEAPRREPRSAAAPGTRGPRRASGRLGAARALAG